jgi:hypothetical protein
MTAALHELLAQSLLTRQMSPSAQPVQAEPPQPTSVSVPSLMALPQVPAGVQVVPPQALLAQSPFAVHPWPTEQVVAHVPPQSMSLSVPFCAPSMHVAA